MVFLTLLRTQLILGENAIDARCLPVERCWTEMFLSQIVRRWGMTSVARRLDWAFSAVDRIPLVKCWFCARIWHNMSRAASLKLRALRLLYWIVCCRWSDACTDCCYCDAFLVSMWYPYLTAKLLLATSLRLNTWSIRLEGTKKYWQSCWAHEEIVMARSGNHRPSVSRGINASRALSREKWRNLLCFPNFLLKMPRARANVSQRIRKEF